MCYYIDSPFEEAFVARQNEKGEWEIIASTIENGMLKFSVDHFCRFSVLAGTEPIPCATITISNFTPSRTEAYKTTITFSATATDAPEGASIHWFIDGKDSGEGESYTVKKAKKTFTVQVKLMDKDGEVLAESEVETVNVKTGFFARLIAFFKMIFFLLPKVTQ